MRTSGRLFGGLVLTAALLMAVGFEVRQVAEATCTIGWLSSDATCDVADDAAGNFAFDLETQWASQGEGAWTLVQGLSQIAPYFNVSDLEEDVDSMEVGDDGGPAMFSDDIPTHCTGQLNDPDSNGSCSLSAWNADTFHCSGGRTVIIKPDFGSCP